MKFSIIIPIYNAEKYLFECLNSIKNQEYDNFEVILIDDGSTDNSSEIYNYFLEQDNRFNLLVQKNSGPSTARNLGIDNSSGDYLIFIDSDDYISTDYLIKLKDLIGNYDFISFGYEKIYKRSSLKMIVTEEQIFNNKNSVLENIFINENIAGFLWNKVFSSKIVKKHNIRFSVKDRYCEDLLFVLDYMENCNSFIYIKNIFYMYRMRMNNLSSNIASKKNLLILELYKKLINKYDNKIIMQFLKYNYLLLYYKQIKKLDKKEKIKYKLKNEKSILNSYKISKKLKIYLIKYFPFIYLFKNKILNKIKYFD